MKGQFLAGVILLAGPLRAEVPLPTPPEHYETYDPGAATLALVGSLMSGLGPEAQAELLPLLGSGALPSDRQGRALLDGIDWEPFRPQVLDLFLHRSRVLEVIPETARDWAPLIHDSLLFLLDRLAEERLMERLAAQARLPADAPRGERLLAFVERTPTLQKIGQILARHPDVPEDFRTALRTLEKSILTSSRDELVEAVASELGPEAIERYQIDFAPEILAEASVGAVIRASLVLPGETEPRRAVCKLIKPYAGEALREELAILDALTSYLEQNRGAYAIGAAPLVDMFEEVREAFSREIQVVEEQRNLARARAFYRGERSVVVPEVYPCSTESVTFMEYIEGEKIADAFPGDPRARARLARRLVDVLTFRVLFSEEQEAIFHGDPHAGNVVRVADAAGDPYRIGLLDWGLLGIFSRSERARLMQLLLGLYLGDAKRIASHMDVLLEDGAGVEAGAPRRGFRELADETVRDRNRRGHFERLQGLVERLVREGYSVHFNTTLFIKSQITLSGILAELDPDLRQDDYLMRRLTGQVFKEVPLRLLRTLWPPGWNSHDYRSLLSNEDVKDVQVHRLGRGLKKAGVGIWRVVTLPAKLF